ncbi:unnamed protein product [Zymoseptoria tritici ST99CH_3D7]|uniref:UDP-glucose 6-dehydrogenase n=1 Tax=Zymoseptoria tritici (strain ST99CH_3D7) TaxID=1276538 RepID=A0A1X7RRD9_ZYMT9|nr:unnamed protein product [Zymoseptoria tritici ST99CH_3D7]
MLSTRSCSCSSTSTSSSASPTDRSGASSPAYFHKAHSTSSLSSYSDEDEPVKREGFQDPAALFSSSNVQRVCFVGGGYVGGPTAAVIAYCNPDIAVTVVDLNSQLIGRWQSKHLPIHEPELEAVVRTARDGLAVDATTEDPAARLSARQPNLFFSTNCGQHIATADVVFLSVNTPTKLSGLGAGAATDISMFESAVKTVAKFARPGTVIVEKSTVPCRTSQVIEDILNYHRPGVPFEVLSNPEFLAEGTAIRDLMSPSRVLIGSRVTPSGLAAAAKLASVYSWVPPSSIVQTNLYSSELSKLVANAMLAQRISSMNTVSAICERVGADVSEVARTIGLDPRIGGKFLRAGLGFGGSCFRKDILSLCYLAQSLGLQDVADYWQQVITINEWQCTRFVTSVIRALNGSLRGKKIAVLGYAFKNDTSDTRESQAAAAIRHLLAEGPLEIAIFDPRVANEQMEKELAASLNGVPSKLNICTTALEACENASAVLVLTEWEQFRYPPTEAQAATEASDSVVEDCSERYLSSPSCEAECADCANVIAQATQTTVNVDWAQVAQSMNSPAVVFDGRGMLDPIAMKELGIRVAAIGRQSSRSSRW